MKFSIPLFAAVLSASVASSFAEQCNPPVGCSLKQIISGNCPDACECPCYSDMNGQHGFLVETTVPGFGKERHCMGLSSGYTLMKKGMMKCVDDCKKPKKKIPCGCPQYKKKTEGAKKLDPEVPKPEKCVMKRGKELLQYKPYFPEERPDVFIEVQIGSGKKFQFYPNDFSGYEDGTVPIVDKDVFDILFNEQEKLGGQGFKLRFVSKNGPGEWNSCKYSPIAFDLNGNGAVDHITSDTGFYIDITGDGHQEHLSEWFSPDEGILIDIHNEEGLEDYNNGIITGDHMMGDMAGQYTDGFAKLATYDENCDDKLTGAELDGLYIWKDENSNLSLDDGELYTLGHFGIVALNTIHNELQSTAELDDGSTILMHDLWFDAFQARRRLV